MSFESGIEALEWAIAIEIAKIVVKEYNKRKKSGDEHFDDDEERS